jgi:signal transduction histidine kinase
MERDLGRLSKVSARFSKIGAAPNLVPVDLAEVLQESVTYIKKRTPHLGGAVQITSEIAPHLAALGNRELMEWVFENLLKNALDALESGGEIRVRGVQEGKNRVEVRISDTGRGIPPAARQRIWEPGFSTKERGWGLGLTLVRRIVEEYHGGRIWVEDNADRRGICFVVRLRGAR